MTIIILGVSSSGMAYKHPGRVGDSPLPGAGLYASKNVLDKVLIFYFSFLS